MKNFDITWKTLPVVVLILAGIGLKVYMRTPGYRTLDQRQVTVPSGNAWIYSVDLDKGTDLRLSADAGAAAMNVYVVGDGMHRTLQAGAAVASADDLLILVESKNKIVDQLFELDQGSHHIYFESNSDASLTLEYKLEYYRE